MLIEKLGGGAVNPASTSRFKGLMKALSYLMGQRRVYVPKALTREILEAVCCIVSVDDLDAMTAASVLVCDLVWGARAADLFLTDWSELQLERKHEQAARVIGLTWRRLRTKNDRLGRKDAPKALQCSTGCEGTLKVTADGRLEGIPCPVHVLLATKALQARAVCVPVHELVGSPWGEYVLPVDESMGVRDGTTVVSGNVGEMRKRVAPTVKVISAEEEEHGSTYKGDAATATPAMLELPKLPKVRGTFFEVPRLASGAVPEKTYVTRAWGNASGVSAKMRKLLVKEAKEAKKAGREPAVDDPKAYSSRSLRSGCATALKDLPADVRMGQLDHSSLEVSNGYIQRHTPFSGSGGINVTDTALSGVVATEAQTMQLARELATQKDGENEQLREENARLRAALGLQSASEAALDERLCNLLRAATARPGEQVQAREAPQASADVTPATPAAGEKRQAEIAVQSAPKKDKPCSPACEAAGLIVRQDWRKQQETVDACVRECCGSLTPMRLQTALCGRQVHTRYKAVEGLLTRLRKEEK